MTEDKSVVRVDFGGHPYQALEELRSKISDLVYEYAGTVPVAGVLGVLRIIEHDLLEQQQ